MSKNILPGFIPIANAGNYTDQIAIGEMGLLSGYHESFFELNLRGMARVIGVGGIEKATIATYQGEISAALVGSTYSQANGAVPQPAPDKLDVAPLSSSVVQVGPAALPEEYRWAHADLWLNAPEIEARSLAEDDTWQSRRFSPRAQAWFMNKGVQEALSKAATLALLPDQGNVGSMLLKPAAVTAGTLMATNISPAISFIGTLLGDGIARSTIEHIVHKRKHPDLPSRKWSLLSAPVDRLMVAKALARTTTFMRAAAG